MDPEPTTPIKIRKRTPEEALEYQTLKLVEVYKELRALKYARWSMFSRSELALMIKGLGYIVLELHSQASPGLENEARTMLEVLLEFFDEYTKRQSPGSDPVKPDRPPGGGE